MTGAMSAKLVKRCAVNYDSYGKDLNLLGIQWMDKFQDKPDDLMETAIIYCMDYCTKFPTIADINNAIKDLTYKQQTKPKPQLPARSKWTSPDARKAFDFVNSGKIKEYIQELDIEDVREFARYAFNDISDDTIRRNYPEILTAKESLDACKICNSDIADKCVTHGYRTTMRMHKSGMLITEMVCCHK